MANTAVLSVSANLEKKKKTKQKKYGTKKKHFDWKD